MLWKKKKLEQSRVALERPVWFILVEVEVTGDSIQPWVAGSRALVQAFVPAAKLETALERLDQFLPSQELVRIDTLKAERYEPNQDDLNISAAYFAEPLQKAAFTDACILGVFVVSQESAVPHRDLPPN